MASRKGGDARGDDGAVNRSGFFRGHFVCMDLARRELGDEIGGVTVGDLNHVEAQLFCGGSRLIGLDMGEPGRAGPVVIAEAKHDDFGGGITIGFWNSLLMTFSGI
jgi:hypothetical protein